LHNIAVKWKIPPDEVYLEELNDELPIPDDNINNNAEQIRRNIVQWYFAE